MYTKGPSSPRSLDDIIFYLDSELRRLEGLLQNFTADSIQFTVHHSEPSKPKEGYMYYADGEDWNPGKGKGPYIYSGDEWFPMFNPLGTKPPNFGLKLIPFPPTFTNTTQKVSPSFKGLSFTSYAPKVN